MLVLRCYQEWTLLGAEAFGRLCIIALVLYTLLTTCPLGWICFEPDQILTEAVLRSNLHVQGVASSRSIWDSTEVVLCIRLMGVPSIHFILERILPVILSELIFYYFLLYLLETLLGLEADFSTGVFTSCVGILI